MTPKARTSTTLRGFQKLRSEKLWAEFSFPKNHPSFWRSEQKALAAGEYCHKKGLRSCDRRAAAATAEWPRIARYRETLSAIPPYCVLWGFWCLNMANWVRYPPPPFSECFPPWRACEVEVRYPPTKGYLSDTCAIYPLKTRQNVRYRPLRYYLERVLRDMGGYLALGRSGHVQPESRVGQKVTLRRCPSTVS